MNFSNELIKVFDYFGEKIGITIDWTSQNVLPHVQQLCEKYISWEISTSIAWIVIGALLIAAGLFVGFVCDWDGLQYMFCTIAAGTGIILIGVQVFDIIQCCAFPEKQIYEYIRDLIELKSN